MDDQARRDAMADAPHCWQCQTPLPSWPKHWKDGRELREAPQWCDKCRAAFRAVLSALRKED